MNTDSFQKARITLTVWYVGILAVILFAFSFVLYTGEQRDFVRVIVQRDFNSRVPHILSPIELDDVQKQLIEIRRAFLVNLISIDGGVLLVGGALSYFLAGETLSPIKKTLTKQKEFLADVSHEIRTPLAAIQTATEVSLRAKNKTKEDYRHVVNSVYDESKRLTKMANDLLLLSRVESATRFHFEKVSLTKIVDDVIATFTSQAWEKQITLSSQIEKNVRVFGDGDSLTQLVMIFLDNAIKYTKSGGTVTVTVEKAAKPTITITDTGIGMSQKDKERIFERFYQADSSRSQVGNGLGLAIAQEIIKQHKANISVSSTQSKGSSFTIVFPTKV